MIESLQNQWSYLQALKEHQHYDPAWLVDPPAQGQKITIQYTSNQQNWEKKQQS